MKEKMRTYKAHPLSFLFFLLVMLGIIITVFIFIFIVGYIASKGLPHIKPSLFALEYNSTNVSVLPSIITTVIMVGIALVIAAPLGIFCAIYLVEYAKRGNKVVKIIRITTETLSGIPSIIYGLFGAIFFVRTLGLGISILSGALTCSIMVLPIIIRSTEEALKSIDDSFREGSFGLGAGKLRTVFKIVVPSAVPGILSGIILSTGRIIGETAALIYTAGSVAKVPTNLLQSGRTLSIHVYNLSSEGLHVNEAYASAVILLIVIFALNAFSGFVAKKITK